MKPEEIYQNLKDLSDRLGVTVSDENFRKTSIKVKSGHCVVKSKQHFIMDKHKSLHDKIDILVSFLTTMDHEDLYLLPTIRELLNRSSERNPRSLSKRSEDPVVRGCGVLQ